MLPSKFPRSRAGVLAVSGIWLVGCTGGIAGGGGQSGDGGNGGASGGEAAGAGEKPVIPATPEACAETLAKAPLSVGEQPIRRLTRAEYDNTILDLLGNNSQPAKDFPTDALVGGFDNHVSTAVVTFTLAKDYFDSAAQLATAAMSNLPRIAPCDVAKLGEPACARDFITSFGLRAFRRPVTDAEVTALLTTYQSGRTSKDHATGIRMAMTRMLMSPHFLYRPELGGAVGGVPIAVSPWELASRLSYFLWSSMPDATLFAAAKSGALSDPEEISRQATRMLADPRAQPALARFFDGWLQTDAITRVDKNATTYPGFRAAVPHMRDEMARFVSDLLWQRKGTPRDLLTARHTFMNRPLAEFLNMPKPWPAGSAFEEVPLQPDGAAGPARRIGILATSGLQAAHSKPDETSPILRGKFILEQFLCVPVPLPPANVPPIPAVEGSTMTTREFDCNANRAQFRNLPGLTS